jgi:hypothetical protein
MKCADEESQKRWVNPQRSSSSVVADDLITRTNDRQLTTVLFHHRQNTDGSGTPIFIFRWRDDNNRTGGRYG